MLSADDRVPPALLADVEEIVKHPLYRREDAGSPDLAVLRLAKPLPDAFMSGRAQRARNRRWRRADRGRLRQDVDEGATAPKPVLRMVLLRVTQTFRGWMILSSIGEDPSGGGPGDSGGPVFTYRGMHTLAGLIIGVSEKRPRCWRWRRITAGSRRRRSKLHGDARGSRGELATGHLRPHDWPSSSTPASSGVNS